MSGSAGEGMEPPGGVEPTDLFRTKEALSH